MRTRIARTRLPMIAIAAALTIASACGSGDGSAVESESAASVADNNEAEPAEDTADATPAAVSIELSELAITGDPLSPPDDPAADSAVGLAGPVVTGQQFDGTGITIGGPTDGPTMLVFLAHWCPHCNDEIPELNALRDAGDIPTELNVVGISTAVAADRDNFPPSEWMVEKDWTWPVLADSADSDAFLNYGGAGFPYTVLLDADGNVIARSSGSSSAAEIKSWIETNLAG